MLGWNWEKRRFHGKCGLDDVVTANMTKSRWFSIAWITVSALLAYGGGVVTFADRRGDLPQSLYLVAIAALLVGLVGATAFVLRWWRSYFRRLFDPRFVRQEDGSYLARRIEGRRREVVVYRIDEATKERILRWMVNSLVALTALFVITLIGAVASNVIWPERFSLMLGFLAPLIGAGATMRWVHHRAGLLMATGTKLPQEEGAKSAQPSRPDTTQNLRPLAVVCVLAALVGCLVITALLLDPEADPITPDLYGQILGLFALLVILPAGAAILALLALRRERRAA